MFFKDGGRSLSHSHLPEFMLWSMSNAEAQCCWNDWQNILLQGCFSLEYCAFNSPKAAMVFKSSPDIQQGSSISSLKSPFSESCQGHALLSEDTLTLTTTRQSSKRGKYLDVTPHKQKKGVGHQGIESVEQSKVYLMWFILLPPCTGSSACDLSSVQNLTPLSL
jgi:hypothetical protein